MLISSIFDKIFRILKFSGKIATSPTCHFPIQKLPYSKISLEIIFLFGNRFSIFYCTFYDKFRSRYWQENVLPPAKKIKILPENSFSEVRFYTIIL